MKSIIIYHSTLKGEIKTPPSKSICHRAMLCAGLSDGVSVIDNVVLSQDVLATIGVLRNLGVIVQIEGNTLRINGSQELQIINENFYCNESGSTLRFIIPIVATAGSHAVFHGNGTLKERPLTPYYDIFENQKIKYKNIDGKLPLVLDGKLKPGEFNIRGNVSSQFISGLLFALPLLDGDSKIIITTKLESMPYIALTIDVLKYYSIIIENKGYKGFIIKGKQKFKASDFTVEGDFSQAAFWIVAGILGANVTCRGLNMNSHQGDAAIIEIVKNFNGKVIITEDTVTAFPSKTKGTIVDASQFPDLVPIITVLAALSDGTTKITNAGRLRLKESDRLKAISTELNKIGADIIEMSDRLEIHGKSSFKGGIVNSWNDHRIAMSLAIASLKCEQPLIINEANCVKKSYPDFWNDFRKLGGQIDEWNVSKQN
jgi:3-phosphoshikimate 1-carboxyvinyltransferase